MHQLRGVVKNSARVSLKRSGKRVSIETGGVELTQHDDLLVLDELSGEEQRVVEKTSCIVREEIMLCDSMHEFSKSEHSKQYTVNEDSPKRERTPGKLSVQLAAKNNTSTTHANPM